MPRRKIVAPSTSASRRGGNVYALLMAHLVAGGTYEQLVEATGLHYHTVSRYVQALKVLELVYICGWKLDDRASNGAAVFRLTTIRRADVPRPPAKTQQQRSADTAARRKRKREAAAAVQLAHLLSLTPERQAPA